MNCQRYVIANRKLRSSYQAISMVNNETRKFPDAQMCPRPVHLRLDIGFCHITRTGSTIGRQGVDTALVEINNAKTALGNIWKVSGYAQHTSVINHQLCGLPAFSVEY